MDRPPGLTGSAELTSATSIAGRIWVRRSRVMEAVYLHDLRAKCMEPDQEPVQGG